MKTGSYEMQVDQATLFAIKNGSKDYRGAVTFEAIEKIGDYTCDRYAYSIAIAGPAPKSQRVLKIVEKPVDIDLPAGASSDDNGGSTTASPAEQSRRCRDIHDDCGALNRLVASAVDAALATMSALRLRFLLIPPHTFRPRRSIKRRRVRLIFMEPTIFNFLNHTLWFKVDSIFFPNIR